MHTAIRWFAHNPVAANLTMIMMLVGGAISALITNQEEFPSIDIRMVQIHVPYLGAAPVEAEKAVCTRCLLYTSPSPRDRTRSRMPSSA